MDKDVAQNRGSFRTIQLALNILTAVPIFGLGILTLMGPDKTGDPTIEGILVTVGLFGTTAVLILAIYRPFSGGLLLLICGAAFALLFNGFHLSEMLLEGRPVGYSAFWSTATACIFALGALSVVRARTGRR